MDAKRIVEKAIERGFVSKAQAERMSDQEKINLIFENGFSTKDLASDISGRGIGMDVVKMNIARMGGKIIADTKFGLESSFTIVLNQAGAGE